MAIGIILLLVGINATGSYVEDVKIKDTILSSFDGNILYVGGAGPNNYTTIQEAIDDAVDGDTVFVFNGTYFENVRIRKSVSLIGEDRDTTIIDGNYSGTIISVHADCLEINGFTIQNSGDSNNEGIYAETNDSLISNNRIINNELNGIKFISSSRNVISGNIISDIDYCGISLCYSSNNNKIVGNTIEYNGWGAIKPEYPYALGGIEIWHLSNHNKIIGNNIKNNNDGGINLSFSFFNVITNNNFIDNNFNAYFEYCSFNFWFRNYWDDHNGIRPKRIDGHLFLPWNTSKIISWVNFDLLPSQIPFDI